MSTGGFILWREGDRRHLLLVAVLVFVLAALVTVLYVVFTVIVVDGPSMDPALADRERILVTRGYSRPEAGDVIAFFALDTDGRAIRLLKRVVAVEGDTVEIVGDIAYVNGELSQVAPTARIGGSTTRIGPFKVPEDAVYVLGDNRPVSLDSRYIGPIPVDSVIGKGVVVILPLTHIRDIDE